MTPEIAFALALSTDHTKVACNAKKAKKATMIKLSAEEKLAMVDGWAREMAKEAFAPLVKELVGKGMHAAVGTGLKTRAAVGAGIGAAGGAAKHMLGPKDEQGNRHGSLLGSMAGGAAIGAGAGAGARAAAQHLGSMNNAVGKYTGGALQRTVRQAGVSTPGGAAASKASLSMAQARGTAQKALMADPTKGLAARQQSAARANSKLGLEASEEGRRVGTTLDSRATSRSPRVSKATMGAAPIAPTVPAAAPAAVAPAVAAPTAAPAAPAANKPGFGQRVKSWFNQ